MASSMSNASISNSTSCSLHRSYRGASSRRRSSLRLMSIHSSTTRSVAISRVDSSSRNSAALDHDAGRCCAAAEDDDVDVDVDEEEEEERGVGGGVSSSWAWTKEMVLVSNRRILPLAALGISCTVLVHLSINEVEVEVEEEEASGGGEPCHRMANTSAMCTTKMMFFACACQNVDGGLHVELKTWTTLSRHWFTIAVEVWGLGSEAARRRSRGERRRRLLVPLNRAWGLELSTDPSLAWLCRSGGGGVWRWWWRRRRWGRR